MIIYFKILTLSEIRIINFKFFNGVINKELYKDWIDVELKIIKQYKNKGLILFSYNFILIFIL